MEVWHPKKIEKFEPLSTSVKFNCLGFSGKLLKSTIKQLSFSSLKASFQIWLYRDSKRWTEEKVTLSPIETVSNSAPLSSSASKTSKITSDCQAIQLSAKNFGILNKGTPAILMQVLSALAPWCSSGRVLMLLQKYSYLLCLPW